MSASGKSRSKRGPHKVIKLPTGATPAPLHEPDESNKDLDKTVVDLCKDLMNSDWQAFNMRPPRELFGIYVICKWFAKENQWVLLFTSRGHVRDKLEGNFSGRQRSPIANYLSSYPKEARSALWVKWIKDPYYPYETTNMDDIIRGLRAYNNGERPAFNMDMDDLKDEVPEDFSIIPEWSKKSKTTGTKKSFFP